MGGFESDWELPLLESDPNSSESEYISDYATRSSSPESELITKVAAKTERKRKGPGRPRAEHGSSADNRRNAQRRLRYTQKRKEDQLVRDWISKGRRQCFVRRTLA